MANIAGVLAKLGWSILTDPRNGFYNLMLSKDLKFVMWDRPGLWCSDAEIMHLVVDLKTVIKNSADKQVPEYGVLLGDREDMKTRLISIVYQDGRPIAFSAQAHIDFRIGLKHVHVIHLGLVYVDKGVRGSGMTSITYALPNLLLLLKSGLRSHWISNVTQVPSIFGLVEEFYSNPFPNTHDVPQSFEHYVIANNIMLHHRHVFGVGDDCVYDPKEQIIQNAYTGGSDNLKKTFEETSKSRNEKVNELFRKKLNYDRGDDYLQLGILDYKLLFKFLGAKGIKSRYGLMALNLFFLFFTSLLVPLSRWLIPEDGDDI